MQKDLAQEFYSECLTILNRSKIPFMIGGTFAVRIYTEIQRETKDMDIFCKAADCLKILELFSKIGYKTEIVDERWLGKVSKGQYFFDIIFSSATNITPVTDDWLVDSQNAKLFGIKVKVLPPTELIWSRAFTQARIKYEGSDIAHLILLDHAKINWKRLLFYMDQYWEVLLLHILNFRFIYPSEREIIPRWLVEELFSRLTTQLNTPTPKIKICRGRLFSVLDYAIDIKKFGFADVVGNEHEHN